MKDTAYFISDAHLGIDIPDCGERGDILHKFLREIAPRAEHLFIVGDLFDFWIEYRNAVRPDYFPTLHALYNLADVALVTPLRDGMNLIAKEYLASKPEGKGVLVLSEMAGAATELGEAILVNPNNEEELIGALERALSMAEEEQVERNRAMQRRLSRYNVRRWAEDFLDSLAKVKELQQEMEAKLLTPKIREELLEDYSRAEDRLLLLDYDGTLVPFSPRPSASTALNIC